MSIIDKSYLVNGVVNVAVNADPRLTAVDAEHGSHLFWDDGEYVRQFVKRDDGLSTNVAEVNFPTEYQTEDLNGVPVVISTEADNSDPSLITNWQPVISMTSTDISGGSYEYLLQCLWNMNATNRSALFRTTIDGFSFFPIPVEPKDATNIETSALTILPNQILPNWDITATHTIELDAVIEQGAGATPLLTMQDCLIRLERKK